MDLISLSTYTFKFRSRYNYVYACLEVTCDVEKIVLWTPNFDSTSDHMELLNKILTFCKEKEWNIVSLKFSSESFCPENEEGESFKHNLVQITNEDEEEPRDCFSLEKEEEY